MLIKKKSLREARHVDKFFYLGAHKRFYEPNYPHYCPSSELTSLVEPMLEARHMPWDLRRIDVWSHVMPSPREAAITLPSQGWKIHVSAIESNCRHILVKVATLALEHAIQFKFANDVNTLKLMTSKRWVRGGSGKFITLYPPTDEKFIHFIELLYNILKHDIGSYILSDARYKDCRCLYYRYGSIIPVNRLDIMGRKLQVLTSPNGEQIVDQRSPYFELPSWVSDPFHRAESDSDELTLDKGRFIVKSALGFSNTGGVYLATDTATGEDVVIKEARPHVELAANGQDATGRLAQEMKILRIMDDLGISPRILASFWDWENFYLVEEHLNASDMREVMVMNTPLLKVNPTLRDSEAYYKSYKDMFISLLKVIDQIHKKGVVVGDLSPTNILVDKSTMTVKIIDLEAAYQPLIEDTHDIYTPGFRSKVKGREKASNYQDDIYAVSAIMMYSMMPIVVMAYIRDDLFENVLPVLVNDIGWSRTPILSIIQKLARNTITCSEAVGLLDVQAVIEMPMARPTSEALVPADVCRRLGSFITCNYRLEEIHTLFPIDPFGGHTSPAGFGFGASGIIQSLLRCEIEVPKQALNRYNREIADLKPSEISPGFLTGASGIAWALLLSGDIKSGKRILEYSNSSDLLRKHHSLYYGMAGIGMANLAAYQILGEQRYLDIASDLAETLVSTAVQSERGLHWEDDDGIRIGLGYGQSGVALFLLRLSQLLKVTKWREVGRKALEYDLSFGHEIEPGVITFPCSPQEKNTYEPYIEQGSAGIAKVAIRYGLWEEVDKLIIDAHRKYSGFPGLIYGLSGLVDVMIDAHLYSGDKKYIEMTKRPLQGLKDLYLLREDDGYAIPGENLFRISCDYATGIAGVMRTFYRLANLLSDEFCLDEIDELPANLASHALARSQYVANKMQ